DGPQSNLTSGHEKAAHRRRRRQALPARAQPLLRSWFLRIRAHRMTHERSRAKLVGTLCPDTDRVSTTERAVAECRSGLLPTARGAALKPAPSESSWRIFPLT